MQKIFSVITDTTLGKADLFEVNGFLEDNPEAKVISITPITQYGEGTYRRYGVVIVISTN